MRFRILELCRATGNPESKEGELNVFREKGGFGGTLISKELPWWLRW